MHTAQDIEQAIRAEANPDKAKTLSGFFKTGKGEYGEQDIFIGIPVPVTRNIVKQYLDTPLDQLEILLHNPVHELRMAALLCMVEQFKKADANRREAIYHTYLSNISYIKQTGIWSIYPQHKSSEAISKKQDHTPLYRLAQSSLIWEQRISIVSTWQWIRKGRFDDTLAIADILLYNKHDLIRKAVGWMLREVGKKDKIRLCTFLDTRYRDMPRTMLRYAIEKFSPEERQHYMQK